LARGPDKGLDFKIVGMNRGTHMVVDPRQAQKDLNRTLTHELAHYYWGFDEAPLWFREGGTDFLTSYVRNQLYDEPFLKRVIYDLAEGLRYCNLMGMSNLQKLIDHLTSEGYSAHQGTPYFPCNYSRGEHLFFKLYETLESNPFRAAWKELYQLAIKEGRPLTEQEIYATFRRHTPPDKLAEFEGVYSRLHGGEFSE